MGIWDKIKQFLKELDDSIVRAYPYPAYPSNKLTCPNCGSASVRKTETIMYNVPVVRCDDCGNEWLDTKSVQKPMGVFRTAILIFLMIAIILAVVILIFGFP